MYSALKRDGVPLYRLARHGIEVERAARPVRIDRLVLEPDGPTRLRFDVACSKGTYIRVLAEDIGAALGSAAHLEALRRTGFGSFDIADAVDHWTAGAGHRRPASLTLRQALAPPAGRRARRQGRRGGPPGQGLGADGRSRRGLATRQRFSTRNGEVVAVVVRRGSRSGPTAGCSTRGSPLHSISPCVSHDG